MNLKTVVVTGLLLVSAQISQVVAGVEPSPFQPEINQLGAVANILNSAEFRIVKTMSAPPEACVPPDPCKGLYGDINRLEAINGQVYSAHYMIISMIEEVMGVEPSPFRGDLVAPLEVVGGVAEEIVERIEQFGSPGSVPEEFVLALRSVSESATLVVSAVADGILLLSQDPECVDVSDQAYCDSIVGCLWIYDPFAEVEMCMPEVGH